MILRGLCPPGAEPALAAEWKALGLDGLRQIPTGVECQATQAQAYRVCLWSRIASRVLSEQARFPVDDADSLYTAALALPWPQWFGLACRFTVHVSGRVPGITDNRFAALRVKDAVVDRFRNELGQRPDAGGASEADVTVHLALRRNEAILSLDLGGGSLYRRGWRRADSGAPLKENLAAALLWRAGWPEAAARGAALLDPFCGGGTLLIEGAEMAADLAPGLARTSHALEQLSDFDAPLWEALRAEARQRHAQGLVRLAKLSIHGRDADPAAVRGARANARRAGLENLVQFEVGDLLQARPVVDGPGLLITNPPYGERLGSESEVVKLMSLLGDVLKRRFGGWQAAIFTARPDLAPRLGLRAEAMHAIANGPIDCKLLRFQIPEAVTTTADAGVDFANRLRKNLRHLSRWARRENIHAWRLYDADLPDYAIAVDIYDCEERHAVVHEYAAPDTIDPVHAERRLRAALVQLAEILELPATRIHLRTRVRQRGSQQYGPQQHSGQFHIVEEAGCRLRVNFDDYLDTGLFLDHRPLRRRIQSEAAGRRFLNLFCYTGAATVHAIAGGARESVSVDASNTYLDWARHNLDLNGAGTRHAMVRSDAMRWLQEASRSGRARFDLIFCDPPTFSNSKRSPEVFDIQRDHGELLRLAAALLAPGGTLYFSCNRRRFRLDPALAQEFHIEDITARTLDPDFARPPPPHRAWRITQP
jgi:Predicted N6-adenine-specific DNA methylase